MKRYRKQAKVAMAVTLATTCVAGMTGSILAQEQGEVSVQSNETTLPLPAGVSIKNLGMQRINATGSMDVADHEYELTAEYTVSPDVSNGQTHLQTPHSGTIFGANGTDLQGYSITIPSPSAFGGEAVKAIAHSKGKLLDVANGGTLSFLRDEDFKEHHSLDGAVKALTLESGDKIKITEHMTKVLHYPDGRLVFVNHTMDENINFVAVDNQDVIAQVVKANGDIINIPNVGVVFTPKAADNVTYTPKAQDINVKIGETPDPKLGITYEGDVAPENTTYAWKDNVVPATDAEGSVQGTVVITYPDGTTAEVVVNVIVSSTDSGKYAPVGQSIKVDLNGTLNAQDGIANADQMPENTTYTWKDGTPSTATAGEIEATIVVTYPDTSTDEVTVKITVGNEAERYPATGKKVTVFVGESVEAIEGIANVDDLPAETKYEWKNGNPDTTVEGEIDATITVTYADGSTKDVDIKVEVVEKQAVKYPATGQNIKVDVNGTLNVEDGIANIDQMPTGVSYDWKDGTPSTATPGEFDATIVVSYQDKTTAEVTIKIIVGSDAERYPATGKNINVDVNATLNAEDGIANLDELKAAGVKSIEWKNEPATDQEGTFQATITVTYADGSQTDVNITVTVGGDVSKYEPTIKDETVNQNGTLNPEDLITNKDELPVGTKFTWNKAPDLTVLGEQAVSVLVTYPDGTSEEVEAKVTVVEEPNKDETTTPSQPEDETVTTPSEQPDGGNTDSQTPSSEAPATGDATQAGLWTMIMSMAMGIVYFLRKKDKKI
ncbi:MAG: hypothetical protein K2L08_03630 [Erysipelotrichaceae bacterium]|nr:hypothetical protein [Erysipelotrichaceae bacterium]